MTSPDAVFAMFVEANPVLDPKTLLSLPSAEAVFASLQVPLEGKQVEPRPGRSRRGWTVALASFLIVISLGIGLNWLRGKAESDVLVDRVEAVRLDALSTAEAWLDAVNQADIETAMGLSSPGSRTIADRRVMEWLAGFGGRGMPTRVTSCHVVEVTADRATVECQVRLSDPVAVELGMSELVAPFVFEDGLVAWQPYRGGDISQVNAAYSAYLRRFDQTDYERVCAPDGYAPGSVVQDRLLALTGECAELAAPLAEEVAQWIRDGRPAPAG